MNWEKKSHFQNALLILLGSFSYALAYNWFFAPNNIVMGGFTGLGQIIHHFLPIVPVGLSVMLLNIPLFVIGQRLQGWNLLVSSLIAMALGSVFIDVIPMFVQFEPIEDKLLACIFGGVLTGLSSGLTLWADATTGGTELAARLLKYKWKHLSVGKLCLYVDCIVVLLYTVTFGGIYEMLYAIIAMYIISLTIDTVVYGKKNAKVACIVCSKGEEVRASLLALNLGMTKVAGKGGFSDDDKTVLICAFKPSRIAAIKSVICKVDPSAFVILCDAQDVFGEGFAECRLDSL